MYTTFRWPVQLGGDDVRVAGTLGRVAGRRSGTPKRARSTLPSEAAALRGKPPPPPLCFVEFVSVEAAAAAHDGHNGALLASSDRGGLRLQYAARPLLGSGGGGGGGPYMRQQTRFEGQQWVFADNGAGGEMPGSPSSPYRFGFGVLSPQQQQQPEEEEQQEQQEFSGGVK